MRASRARINAVFCRFLGYSKQELLGKTVRDITHPDDWDASLKRLRQLRSGGDPIRLFEKRFRHKSGRTLWADVSVRMVCDERGSPRYTVGHIVDITARKRLEESLAKANDGLEQKVKERTARLRKLTEELTRAEHQERSRIADILHEQLQQHLCGVKFRACHLKEDSSTPAMIGWADRLVKDMDDAIHVTRTLTTDLHPPVLSHLGVRDAIEWLATEVMGKMALSVTVRTDRRAPMLSGEVKVFAFEAARELLLNVAKHAKVKTAVVRLGSTAKGLVSVQVKDAGVGFDSKAGLPANSHFGLFRIQERAESFGGRFEVVSQPGKGTCATLILPRKDIHSA